MNEPIEFSHAMDLAGSAPRKSFTPVPYKTRVEAITAVLRWSDELLPDPEAKMLRFHTERSLTYNKASDTASLAQQSRGVYRRKAQEVTWIRGGAGLAARHAATANKALESRGLLRRTRHSNEKSGNTPTEYEVVWPAVHGFFNEKQAAKTDILLRIGNKRGTPYRSQAPSPCRSQEQSKNHLQSANPKQSGAASRTASVVGFRRRVKTQKQPPKPLLEKSDDDDRTPSGEKADTVRWLELLRGFGVTDADVLWIYGQMASAGITPQEMLVNVAKQRPLEEWREGPVAALKYLVRTACETALLIAEQNTTYHPVSVARTPGGKPEGISDN